jgi:multimeric flavodoxin WrbA
MIVFGSPIYFYSVSGRMKTFMDRCNGYIWNKKLSSKQAFIVGVGGSTNQTEMVNSLRSYFKALGLIHAGEYFARA